MFKERTWRERQTASNARWLLFNTTLVLIVGALAAAAAATGDWIVQLAAAFYFMLFMWDW